MIETANDKELGARLRMLRQRCGLSLRQLAQQAGVTAGMISCIERGQTSPSIATLSKVLGALGSDLASFFGPAAAVRRGAAFLREGMRVVSDQARRYTIVFPREPGIEVEMLDEHYVGREDKPDFETLRSDIAGYVLAGQLILEVEGQEPATLRPGDAFYIKRGHPHRGYAADGEQLRLITVYSGGNY